MPTSLMDYLRILPEIILTVFGALILLVEGAARGGSRGRIAGALAFIGSLLALAAGISLIRYPGTAFAGMVRVDSVSIYFHILILATVAVVTLLAMDFLRVDGHPRGEFYALLLFAAVGMGFMVSSDNLILTFIGLEISSISSYVLCAYRRHAPKSTEAALKYLLLGSFATAFFLYGITLLYGASGSVSLPAIGQSLAGKMAAGGLALGSLIPLAAALIFVGLGFKVSAAPFQVWTPDVYEGAPALVTGFISTAAKAAAFVILLRVFYVALRGYSQQWFWLMWVAAILSMTLGNIGALRQTSLKRMLAYSSVAQAGYILVAFAVIAQNPAPRVLPGHAPVSGLLAGPGVGAILFYLTVYTAMNLGAFAVIARVANRGERFTSLADFAGLGKRHPGLALAMTLFLLSLLGVPFTGGFLAKLYIFQSAFQAHLIGLAIVALVNTVIAAWYYLRVVVYMYMRPAEGELPPIASSPAWTLGAACCAAVVLWLGILPGHLLHWLAK